MATAGGEGGERVESAEMTENGAFGGETHQKAEGGLAALTTQQGVVVADDQNSLRAGERGPTLLEDFPFREKIFHFDHERIPERVVHARGYGAHGYFENYQPLAELTRADLFARSGQRTPVFVRFSTVAGNQGSADLARDVRGFAVKFYTAEGNGDLVGNNIPVFFIQDAMRTAAEAESVTVDVVAAKIGGATSSGGSLVSADQKLDGAPSVLYDAVVIAASEPGAAELAAIPAARDFVTDAYAHRKFFGYTAPTVTLFSACGLKEGLDDGFVEFGTNRAAAKDFLARCRQIRFWARQP
jgi:putative intracellular protease/amidase